MELTVDPTRPTPTQMYSCMNSAANFCMAEGNVALNINVCRSPARGMLEPWRSVREREKKWKKSKKEKKNVNNVKKKKKKKCSSKMLNQYISFSFFFVFVHSQNSRCTIFLTCGSKPISNILSASSNIKNWTLALHKSENTESSSRL